MSSAAPTVILPNTPSLSVGRGARRKLFLAAAVALLDGCAPTSPGAPPSPILVIKPELQAMTLGQSVDLTAWERSSDGSERAVNAAWQSDRPDALSIDEAGHATTRSLGMAAVVARFDTLYAQRSIRVVPDFGGRWSGRASWTACHRISGNGPNICGLFIGSGFTINLTIVQTEATARGSLTIYGEPTVGAVSGSITEDHALVLSGTVRNAAEQITAVITSWTTTLDPTGHKLIGQFQLRDEFVNGFGLQRHDETIELTNVVR